MEGRKQPAGSSSSSFTSELFGSKESSSSAILGAIFPPSSKYEGEGEGVEKQKQDPSSQSWRPKSGNPDNIYQRSEGASQGAPNRDTNPFYQEEKVQPCHLSSSIYYGGQDVYLRPKNSQTSTYTTFNKDGGEDDSGSASRGNWWKGSLYY